MAENHEDQPALREKASRSVKSASDYSGFSRTALYEANRKGELIFRKNGSRTIILDEDLHSFLRNLPVKDTTISQTHRARALRRWQRTTAEQIAHTTE